MADLNTFINIGANTANFVGDITATNLGNVSAVDLNGNANTVLAGDGTWIAQSGGSGNSISNGTSNVTIPTANSNIVINANTSGWTFGADGNLTAPGNISAAGNITAPGLLIDTVTGITSNGGNININQITGLGGYLNAVGANLSGDINTANLSLSGNIISNANISGNVNAANISAGNISLSGNIFAYGANIYSVNGLTMEGGNLTMSSITGLGGSISAEGNIIGANLSAISNVSGQNINGGNLSLSGNVISDLNIQQGNISVSGNITSGSELTVVSANITGVMGLTVSGGDIMIPSSMSGGSLSAYGNITGNYFIGNGSQLTDIVTNASNSIANGSSNVSIPTNNGEVVINPYDVTGTNKWRFSDSGTLYMPPLATIVANTSGMSLTTNDTPTAQKITLNDTIGFTPGNIVLSTDGGNYAWTLDQTGNLTVPGAILTNSNSQLQMTESANTAYLGTTADDSTALYLTATTAQLYANGEASISSNVGGGNAHGWAFDIDGNTNIPGDIISFGNIGITTNVGNTTSSWTFDTAGNLTAPGSINGTTISGSGNVTGANLRTVGSISATGNITGGNLTLANGQISATYTPGSTTGSGILSQGANTNGGAGYFDFLKATNQSGGSTNPNKWFRVNSTGALEIINSAYSATIFSLTDTGSMVVPGNLAVQGNLTYNNLTNITTANLVFGLGNTQTGANVTGAGFVVGNTNEATFLYNYSSQTWNSNIGISAAGNVSGNNIRTTGLVSATGNITGNYILGNGALLTGVITSVANINSGNSNVTVTSAGGNVTVGVGGTSNVAVFAATGEYVTGVVSATGNIAGNYFIGNGSQLTGIANIVNGTSNISIASANSNITLAVGGISTGVISNAAIGIGNGTGNAQGLNSIAIGKLAGNIAQGSNSVAIGYSAASYASSFNTVAIGPFAGNSFQSGYAIAIGSNAAGITQGSNAIAIGRSAGQNTQGANSVAIGAFAGTSAQAGNSIIINATGTDLPSVNSGFYVNPVRNDSGNTANIVFYNSTTKEVTFSNSISITGNITGGNVLTGGVVSATGNVYAGNVIINGQATTYGTVTPAYMVVGLVTNVSGFGNGSTFILDTIVGNTNSQVSYNSSTGVFTLTAGVTYDMSFTPSFIGFSNSTSGFFCYDWVDATTNVQLDTTGIGTGTSISSQDTTAQQDNATARVIYKPTTNQTVKLRVTNASGTVILRGGIGTQAVIKPLNPTIAVQATSFGNVSASGYVSAAGNVTGANFVGNGSGLTNVAQQTTGSWSVTAGTNTYSFTVPANATYAMWVRGSIPNGIIAWNATATVTNTNVPIVGQQFAWVYNGAGTPLDFVSIPNQFTGTGNAIVRSNVSPSITTNRFDFSINNTSGNTQIINYGYTTL
jgi:hypothetical protein